jgi:hypothetical protein
VKKPIEQDDPDQSAQTVGPSKREVRKQWAESGDVDALLNLIRDTPWCLISIGEQLRNLHRACEVRARSDPEGFARDIFARMIGFHAFLVLRSQQHLYGRIVGRGELPSTAAIADLPTDTTERLLPRLLESERVMCELLHGQASTARQWALTRAKEAKAEREVTADRKAPRRGHSSNGEPARLERHTSDAKVKAVRNGVVPHPVRGGRRA